MSLKIAMILTILTIFGFGHLYSAETIQVDFASDQGPALRKASGFHGGWENAIPDKYIDEIKPRCVRRTGESKTWDRAKRNGTTVILVTGKYGTENDWNSLKSNITNVVNEAKAHRNQVNIHLDVWNEPDIGEFWKSSKENFFETYKKTYQHIRTLDKDLPISGPSISKYNAGYLKDFLKFCKANNIVPDILDWHEFDQSKSRQIVNHVEEMKSFMKSEGIPIPKFRSGEMMRQNEDLIPGKIISYFAQIERSDIQWAGKAYWRGKGKMANILTDNYKPKSAWWTYKGYAAIAGRMVDVKPSASVDGMASYDKERNTASLLLGRFTSGENNVEMKLTGLKSAPNILNGENVFIKMMQIPSSGDNELIEMKLLSAKSYKVEGNNNLTVTIPNFKSDDALLLEFTKSGTTGLDNMSANLNREERFEYLSKGLIQMKNGLGISTQDANYPQDKRFHFVNIMGQRQPNVNPILEYDQ